MVTIGVKYLNFTRNALASDVFMSLFLYRFLDEVGRHNYVTPTSYLELINAFKNLLTQKRDEVRQTVYFLIKIYLISGNKQATL